jgi:ubiquinol-cytochrome c reductase cytochrome b subunit
VLHLTQVFLWGAYKERREALWLVGVVLLNLVLGFGFTGYLLPWDQKAYFGTQVAGGIAGSIPFVGDEISRLVLGGSGVGQATLSRFYALHVFVLPALVVLLVVVHLYLFRFVGPSGPVDPRERERRTERFFPAQFFKDTVASVAIAVVLAALAASRPAVLGPEADPSVGFVPRPEWYFLWTFQLLKYVPAFAGGVVVPGLVMTALALAPFLDRSPNRSLRSRFVPVAAYLVVFGVMGALTAISLSADARDPKIAAQEEEARRFMAEPFEPATLGDPPPTTSVAAPPAVFTANCAVCHGPAAEGGVGPSLVGITSRPSRSADEIVRLLADPRAFGLEPAMPAFPELSEADRRAIAAWLAGEDVRR